MNKKNLIKLFTILSKIKNLYEIEINFKNKLTLSKEQKEKIHKLFPNMAIQIHLKDLSYCLKLTNNNAVFCLK